MKHERVAGILLAAGGSVRMGEPKQLLEVCGTTLIQRAAVAMLEAGIGPVIVVVGRQADQMRASLEKLDVIIAENTSWERGMGSSIRTGVAALRNAEREIGSLDGALMSVCDQPLVEGRQLQLLIERWREAGTKLAAATYGGTIGTPAIFGAAYFPQLETLEDHAGAKGLLKAAHAEELITVPMDEAAMDVDTPADWHHFRQLFTARSRTA